jgi:hypothetical protein
MLRRRQPAWNRKGGKTMSDNRDGEYRELNSGGGEVWSDRKHWLWFPFSFTTYSVKDGRLYVGTGAFSSREDECLLYRITDISLTRSFGQKICGTGTIHLNTTDRSTPVIHLTNIKHPVDVKRMLSNLIEKEREAHDVAGKEMYGAIGRMGPMDFDSDLGGHNGGHNGGHHGGRH